jgi:glutaredoxin
VILVGFTFKCGFTTAVKHDINIKHDKEAKMIRVIGSLGCVNCEITKQTLKKKGIGFTYEIFNQLPENEQIKLNTMATSKGILKMPLILKDDELTTIAEL